MRPVSCSRPKTLIGSSGTFDTLSEIHQKKMNQYAQERATELPITQNSMIQIFHELISKNKLERLLIPGMIELRVDMIVSSLRYLSSSSSKKRDWKPLVFPLVR